ncbi:unnamed protein product [Rhodiola kirilowii]
MAFLVSFSSSFPSRSSLIESSLKLNYCSTPSKASLQEKAACSAVSRLSSSAYKNSVELAALNHAHRSVYHATWGFCQDTWPSRRQLPRCVPCNFIAIQSTQTIISGYWYGPDVDDGWGFVEAYVDQTT